MSDSPLTEYCIETIKSHGWEVFLWFGIVAVGVGFVVGWGTALLKTKAQIAQIKEQARKASGDNIGTLAQLRETVNSKQQTLDMAQQNMRDALLANNEGSNNVHILRSCRDEMCNVFTNDYLLALSAYAEMIPRLVDGKDAKIRAQTELIPGLESMCKFLHMVNLAEMLGKIPGSQPYQLHRNRRDGLFARVRALLPLWRIDLRWKVRKIQSQTDQYLRQ